MGGVIRALRKGMGFQMAYRMDGQDYTLISPRTARAVSVCGVIVLALSQYAQFVYFKTTGRLQCRPRARFQNSPRPRRSRSVRGSVEREGGGRQTQRHHGAAVGR